MIPSQQNPLFVGLLLSETHVLSLRSLSPAYCNLFLNDPYYLVLIKENHNFFLAKQLSCECSVNKLTNYYIPHVLSLLKKLSLEKKMEDLIIFTSKELSPSNLEEIIVKVSLQNNSFNPAKFFSKDTVDTYFSNFDYTKNSN